MSKVAAGQCRRGHCLRDRLLHRWMRERSQDARRRARRSARRRSARRDLRGASSRNLACRLRPHPDRIQPELHHLPQHRKRPQPSGGRLVGRPGESAGPRLRGVRRNAGRARKSNRQLPLPEAHRPRALRRLSNAPHRLASRSAPRLCRRTALRLDHGGCLWTFRRWRGRPIEGDRPIFMKALRPKTCLARQRSSHGQHAVALGATTIRGQIGLALPGRTGRRRSRSPERRRRPPSSSAAHVAPPAHAARRSRSVRGCHGTE